MKAKQFYFIPGRGEALDNFISRIILETCSDLSGREILPPFSRLRFNVQLRVIRSDLTRNFWHPSSILLGRSYGAYLLLHALAKLSPFPGKVLLFSPVLGAARALETANQGYGSIPPRAKKLAELSQKRMFPEPRYLEIHTGSEDNGCDPALAQAFSGSLPDCGLFIADGAGHELEPGYIRRALQNFLCHDQNR